MALCRYYQQGYCKFGNSCRFEHPNANNANNRNQPTNRFGALGTASGSSSSGGLQDLLAKYHITPDVIEKDLTVDAPQWILSAYAPGRDAPDQLFGGYPREQSFEELRLHYWMGKASGNEQGALNEAQQLWQNAKQQMENAVRNPIEAIQFIVEGENRHPNRHDVCREGSQGAPFGEFAIGKSSDSNYPFGSGSAATTTSAFGQPSALGQRGNPFGQPSQPASTFGQASQQAAASPFGQPSQAQNASSFGGLTSQGQSAFGQPSQLGSSFGQPSALGAKPSPFGAPSFGQTSQPNTQNSSPFGQSQAQTQGSAFGQPGQLGQKPNPFASTANSAAGPFASAGNNAAPAPSANPFAVSAQTNAAPNPFASPTNQNQAGPGAFAQSSQPPFGQPSSQASNAFASANQGPTPSAGNPFAQQPQPQQTPFGQQTDGTSSFGGRNDNANPFGQQQQQQRMTNGTNGVDAGDKNSPYAPNSTRQHPPIDNYASRDMTGRLVGFKDKPVSYKDGQPGIQLFDGTWNKIWFPNGPPGYNKDTELPLELYDENSKTRWSQFAQTGAFADGIMPDLPPPRECTQWDF